MNPFNPLQGIMIIEKVESSALRYFGISLKFRFFFLNFQFSIFNSQFRKTCVWRYFFNIAQFFRSCKFPDVLLLSGFQLPKRIL